MDGCVISDEPSPGQLYWWHASGAFGETQPQECPYRCPISHNSRIPLGKRKILMGKAERGRATRSPPLRSTEGFGLDEVKFLGYLPCLPRILLDQRLQRLNPGLQHRRVGGPPETALQSVDPSAPSDCLSPADPDIA